jgi:hypothetical protein
VTKEIKEDIIMDVSIRKQYRITPDEEDELAQRVSAMMRALIAESLDGRMADAVSKGLGYAIAVDETLTISYDLKFTPGLILANLGEIRGTAKKQAGDSIKFRTLPTAKKTKA